MQQTSNSFQWYDFENQVEAIADLNVELMSQLEDCIAKLNSIAFYKRPYVRIKLAALKHPYWDSIKNEILKKSLRIVIQATSDEARLLNSEALSSQGVSILQIIVTSTKDSLATEHLENFNFYITLVVNQKEDFRKWLQQLPPDQLKKVYFRFEFPSENQPDYLSCKEIQKLFLYAQKINFTIKQDPGTSIFETHYPDEELNPHLDPILTKESRKVQIKISVVLPTYNNKFFLLNTLKHLLDQEYDRDKFEILVIDDGSTDGTQDYIFTNLIQRFDNINFKYFYWPKINQRLFRAGHARNLGAYHSKGETVLFLDSDMLLRQNFLAELEELLKTSDVIQSVRHHIHPQKSNSHIHYADVQPQDTYVEEEKYWRPFFEAESWHLLNLHWKYTCTYCLAVRKKLFLDTGGFRRAYTSYGFEDTELGLKMMQKGARFHLNKTICLHLTQKEDSLDNKLNHYQRQSLLAKTAKVFFRNNPSLEIYNHFHLYMMEEKLWYWRLKSKFSLFKDSVDKRKQ